MAAPRVKKPGPLMRWVDTIHRWTGAIIGVLLAVMGLSGTLLIHEDAWLRATVPHAADALVADTNTYSAVMERFMSHSPRPINVIFPSESLGVYTLSFGEGAGAYADQSGAVVTKWDSKWQRPEVWLFDLHHHLFMGDTGTTVVGVLALIGLGFVVTGVLVWWRSRREFKLRVLPASLSRLQILRHHRDIGVAAAPLLIVLFLTGSMLAFRPIADFLFAPWSPMGTITASLAPPETRGGAFSNTIKWREMIAAVRAEYPDAQLRGIGIPRRRDGQLMRVRLKQPEEWLPNGRTIFWLDPAYGRVIESRDALVAPAAARAYDMVFPLHASRVGGVIYKIIMTATGLTLTMLGSLAVYAFWGYRARRSPRRDHRPAVRTQT